MKKFYLLSMALLTNAMIAQSYNNGGLSTGTVSKSGATAPNGYTWSEVQSNTGNTTESNTSAGFSGSYVNATNNFFLADDFTIPPGSNWKISAIDFFAYQTGYSGAASPFNTARVSIYNTNPSVPGATGIWGNDTTNRFSSSTEANMYRIFNSAVPAPGSAPGTTRRIWKITANTDNVILGSGTYWIKFQLQNTTSTANFVPPVTIPGSRGLASFNGLQYNAVSDTWTNVVDEGNPAEAPDYTMDFPFIITFTPTSLATNEILQYDNRIQVYPNPVKTSFKINNPEHLKIVSVEVFDVSGKVVKTLKAGDEYNVSDLAKGTYILKIKNENGFSKITKLLKE